MWQKLLAFLNNWIEVQNLKRAEKINVSSIKTVCFISGPYRNLSSLTASISALHPNCQVLNHANKRILNNSKIDFFTSYSQEKFNLFIKYAILLSKSGKRGRFGGSITFSHAFDNPILKKIYQKRFGNSLVKKDIQSLIWKESLYLEQYLKKNKINLSQFIKNYQKIKFLLPIRNPLDCAISNKKTNLALIYPNVNADSSVSDIIKIILDDFITFFKYAKKHPNHFFCFFQHSFTKETLVQICQHLDITPDKEWQEDVLRVFKINPSYVHEKKDVLFYKKYIKTHFQEFPKQQQELLRFLD